MNKIIEEKLESIMTMDVTDSLLEIDIATPNVPSNLPFVTDYVEYTRYETTNNEAVAVADIRNNKNKKYKIDSDIYSLTYMPNAIYAWVAPNDAMMYGSNFRSLLNTAMLRSQS